MRTFDTIQKASSLFVVMTVLSHIFCCGLPLVMSIVGLGASFGVFTLNSGNLSWFHAYEGQIMAFSGVVLALGAMAQLISWRIDCRKDGHCSHEPCAPKKRWSLRVLVAAAALYAVNLSLLLVSHGH